MIVEVDLADVEKDRRSRLMLQLGEAIRSGVRAVDYGRSRPSRMVPISSPSSYRRPWPQGSPASPTSSPATMSSVLAELQCRRKSAHGHAATYPDDEAALEPILDRAPAIVRVDFPETAAAK